MNELVLVERAGLLAELLGFAAEGFSGHGRLVFLGGEAGVGKTSLTRELGAAVGERCNFRLGAVDNLTTADPLAAFQDALPELQVTAQSDRLQLFRSLRDALRSEPTLLVLEDLHWADEATLDALRFLGRRLDGLPVLVVVTYRHDEVSPRHPLTIVMGDLAGVPGVSRRLVPPLTPDGVALLVARLSAAAAEVAAGAAILGTAAPIELLTVVSGKSVAAVDECVERGVLVVGRDGLGFRHELAREAVEQSLSVVQRRRLHQRALRRLSELDPADHRTLAHHALRAGEDELAVQHATAAAERAAGLGAHREAVLHYQLALRAEPLQARRPQDRARMFEALSYECYLTDRIPEAITARRRALEPFELDGPRARVGDCQRWLSRLSWFLGHNEDAERYAAQAVATLEPLGDSHELAMAYSNLSQLRMLAGEPAATEFWGGRALELGRKLGDREAEIHALNNVGAALSHTERSLEGRALLQRSLDLALAADAHEHAARAFTNLISIAISERRYGDALRSLTAGIAYCDERDLDSWTRYMESWQVVALGELGSWDDALGLTGRLLGQPDLDPVSAISAAAAGGRIRARRGEDAAELLGLATRLAATTGELQRIAPAACGAAEAAWLAGRPEEIAGLTSLAWDLAAEHPDPWLLGELRWWCTVAGVAPDDGPVGAAAEPFELMAAGRWSEAAAAWEALACPLWVAYSVGFGTDAASAQRAVVILNRLGAAASIEALLRTRGERGLPRPPRPRVAARARVGHLTAREFDVLLLLAEGLSTPDMAGRLVLSPRTVEHHVSAVLTKLGEPTRARAVATARRLGAFDEGAP